MAEPQTHQVFKRGHNTKFNGLDGQFGSSASLWLADMDRHRDEGSSPSMYLQHIDRQLEGEAAQWVLNTPSVRALVYKGYMDLATGSDIDAFHDALSERFKPTLEEATAIKKPFPALDIVCLGQGASETLEQSYVRARDLTLSLLGRDDDNDALTSQELSLRGIVVARFVTGLRDDWTISDRRLPFRMLQQQIVHQTRILYNAFKMAEVKESNDRKQKEQQQKEQERELATKQEQPTPRYKLKFGTRPKDNETPFNPSHHEGEPSSLPADKQVRTI